MSGVLYGVAVLAVIGLIGIVVGAMNLYDEVRRPTPPDPLDDELRELIDREGRQ